MERKDSLGDRMKANYEDRQRHYLARRTPVIVRVDGKAFHTFTRGMRKPFDPDFITAMWTTAKLVSEEMQGFKLAYVQSDEASFLLTDYDALTTEAWFDNNKSKVETVTASLFTAYFNRARDWGSVATFDARAFNIPKEEVANYFLWRAKDWNRNSISMYCRSVASSKQMHGRGRADQHELLHIAGKNWTTDLTPSERNGTFIIGDAMRFDVLPAYADVNEVVEKALASSLADVLPAAPVVV